MFSAFGQDIIAMKSLAESLPAEFAQYVHPDWRRNELEYWRQRDELCAEYEGRWVAFADGAVIASDTRPVTVLHAAQSSGRHPFVIRVGHEEEPKRIRRSSFPYDTTYSGEPLPVVALEFRVAPDEPGVVLDTVIPDTGADVGALPLSDCQMLQLDFTSAVPARMAGVGTNAVTTLEFALWVLIDGAHYECSVQAVLTGTERILGRDVLNRMNVLFAGPTREVVFNPDV